RRTLGTRAVTMDIAPDLPLVMVDPRLFHHCLINLIENAVRHGGEEGAIILSAQRRADGLDLLVLDEGPGLPPGMSLRIFEVFTRVEGSDRKGGTGLGLAIVRGFARAMGIDVSAANRSDRPGARFTLHFSESQLRKISAE
ncbi:sensor histidine kinase KdpD, partial [Novosphingobium sp. B-7]